MRNGDPAASWLHHLIGSAEPIDARDVCILVAHPDDETLGCGGQLSRLRNALLAVITDGSPEDLTDAKRAGLDSREAYASLRRKELQDALDACGASVDLLNLDLRDQTAAFHMPWVVRMLVAQLVRRNARIILTHTYEGGHPDHDAAALVAQMSAILARRAGLAPAVVEMPYYRADGAGIALQRFGDCQPLPTEASLPARAQVLKRRMIRAHASQRWLLEQFNLARESFRIAPAYRFDELPNAGLLLYARYAWGMSGERWLDLVQSATCELGVRLP